MNAPFIRGRYKVTCVLYAEASYAALQAVDIQSREKKPYVLNVYEGAYLKPYLRSFHALRCCGGFREMFVWEESLVAVFECVQGTPIDQVFCKGAAVDWKFRLKAAGDLFKQALLMSDFPPQISCAAMLSENVRVFPQEDRVGLSWVIRPLAEMNGRELVFLLSDQIQKVLALRWDSPREERDFVRALSRGDAVSAAAAYGRWAEAEPVLRGAYEKLEARRGLDRLLHLLVLNVKDWTRVHFRKRR